MSAALAILDLVKITYQPLIEISADSCTLSRFQAVKPLVSAALAISDLVKITGRKEPTVIT